MPEPIATFTRDGVTRHAYTRADMVQFKFDGWQLFTGPAEVTEPTVPSVSLDLTDPDENGDES